MPTFLPIAPPTSPTSGGAWTGQSSGDDVQDWGTPSDPSKQTIVNPAAFQLLSLNAAISRNFEIDLLEAGTNDLRPMTREYRAFRTSGQATGNGYGFSNLKELADGAGVRRTCIELDYAWLNSTAGAQSSVLRCLGYISGSYGEIFEASELGLLFAGLGTAAAPGIGTVDASGFFSDASGGTIGITILGVPCLQFDGIGIGVLAQAGTPHAPVSLGATLTNNVVASGAANVLPDFTNGVVYATDYASLHATISQMAKKLTAIETELKAEGFIVT